VRRSRWETTGLLGRNKRGVGENWVGFGGKIEPNTTDVNRREAKSEEREFGTLKGCILGGKKKEKNICVGITSERGGEGIQPKMIQEEVTHFGRKTTNPLKQGKGLPAANPIKKAPVKTPEAKWGLKEKETAIQHLSCQNLGRKNRRKALSKREEISKKSELGCFKEKKAWQLKKFQEGLHLFGGVD